MPMERPAGHRQGSGVKGQRRRLSAGWGRGPAQDPQSPPCPRSEKGLWAPFTEGPWCHREEQGDGQRPDGQLTLGSRPPADGRDTTLHAESWRLISAPLTGKGGIYKGRGPAWLPASSHPLREAGAFSRLPCSVELKERVSDTEKQHSESPASSS